MTNFISATTNKIKFVSIKASAVLAVEELDSGCNVWLSGLTKPLQVIEPKNSIVRELVIQLDKTDK